MAREEYKTQLSDMIAEALKDKGWSALELAKRIDTTYEYVRRVVRGDAVPSRFVLKAIAEALGLPFKATDRVANVDRIRIKFGDLPAEMSGKKPGLEPIERVWDTLTPAQQQDATAMIVAWAKRNKKAS